jgi:hypothetical protein
MLSQKLFVHVSFYVYWQKPTFGGENPLDLPLIPLASVLSAIASGPDQRLKAFSH